ncbi:class I SAM-dependent methyltransferase [Micromonospora fiedleri]|uniref:Class I SAM-dependent methyltransferase n=1 Tax=Micromonospora fiedleri TaxID=1157498 RepID=A0ABS1UT85_9ACTN|nr:class I SAM-dependent methyltransferase [Micromonospora fiedleri]MBL6279547.1 class I SAM-dependent methyltransferase [Micromonospora fiedleri]
MTTETAVTLPGGEMLTWSDRRADAGNRPLAALVARLVPPGADVLLAGPVDPAVLDALGGARVTALLRGYPDAAALADRVDRVMAAGATGLPTGEAYDVVIAAAGLDAVESVEGPRLGWGGVLGRLAAAVRPGGVLLLRLDNPLGVHRLVAASGWYVGRDDAEWTVGGVLDTGRPANLDQLRLRLDAVGLRVTGSYAGYPRPESTTALLATDELARRTTSGLFEAVLQESCTRGYAGRFVLADPARLAVDALYAGRAGDLAPSWLAVAHRPPAFDDECDRLTATRTPLPAAVLSTGDRVARIVEVVDGPHGWHWHRPGPVAAAATPAPYASREIACLDPAAPDGPVPDGRLLHSLLLDGCLRRDTALLRRLLRNYADWLTNQAATDRLTGAVALAGVDNLVVAGDRFAVLDPSWRADDPLPVDVVLFRALWRFATELLTGGYAHPWTSTLDAVGLTVVLGGVAGRDFDRAVVDAALDVEAAVRRIRDAEHRDSPDVERGGGPEAGLRTVTSTDPPPGRHSYQQLRDAWLRQRDENTRLAAALKWTEDLLASREKALRRAEAKLDLLSGTVSYQLARLAITPARIARRGARAAKRRARAAITRKDGNRE